jgi:acyl-CoA reductase-like NAD-dependent aldehyde dehydrogenase
VKRQKEAVMAQQSTNPATEEVLGEFEEDGEQEIEAALQAAETAFGTWRGLGFGRRSELLRAAAGRLRDEKQALAELITLEMGKPIGESEAEIEKCAWACDYFAEHAEAFLADLDAESGASESYVAFDPIGTVLAIMPWNFPFWQVFRFAAPALMAGNTAILKHASNVPQCALAIERVLRQAGVPDGVFRSLLLPSANVGRLIDDERIRAVTLTGSDIAGAKVAESSGRNLKKTVLELGGSDPFIVLADADLERAASTAVNARYQNAGQSCIAAKRFIVQEAVADEFVERFAVGMQSLALGDPMDRATKLGPLARDDLRSGVEDQVRASLAKGARLVMGGSRPERKGYYYAATLLDHVQPGMAAFDEETFGPLAALVRAASAEEAIELANRSKFGLGAALWTGDVDRARGLARRIESGSVFINGMVASDPRLPFGGVKRSGYGRELGQFGIREFVNIKTVWIGPPRQQTATPSE